MSFNSSGYDIWANMFSPEGRIYQIEYAQKAVQNGGTAIGLRGKDGVVFANEKLLTSKLYEAGTNTNKRIFTVDHHVGVAAAGLVADTRQIVQIAAVEAAAFKFNYNKDIPLKFLKDQIGMYMHQYTLYSCFRPFGTSVLMGAYECDGPQMYCIDPRGTSWGYFGCAVGRGKQAAETEMESINIREKTVVELVKEAAKIIYICHDDVKDEVKDEQFELELSWVGKITNGKHEFVPRNVLKDAEDYAKAAVVDDIEDD